MKTIWTIKYLFHYSEANYIEKFFIGSKEWAQQKANEHYDTLPDWMKNCLYRWDSTTIKSKDEFLVEEYHDDKVLIEEKSNHERKYIMTDNDLFNIYIAGFNHGSNEGIFPKTAIITAFERLKNGESPRKNGISYLFSQSFESKSKENDTLD